MQTTSPNTVKTTASQALRSAKSTFTATTQVKVVGVNGQISLGKQYAGRQVLLEESEAGVWLIRTATVIPDQKCQVYTD
jgi:flavin-binding protein dodecin